VGVNHACLPVRVRFSVDLHAKQRTNHSVGLYRPGPSEALDAWVAKRWACRQPTAQLVAVNHVSLLIMTLSRVVRTNHSLLDCTGQTYTLFCRRPGRCMPSDEQINHSPLDCTGAEALGWVATRQIIWASLQGSVIHDGSCAPTQAKAANNIVLY
jgi:hypothetical protein